MDTPIFNGVKEKLNGFPVYNAPASSRVNAARRKAIKAIQDRVVRQALKELRENDGTA